MKHSEMVEKYRNDPAFHHLVNAMAKFIIEESADYDYMTSAIATAMMIADELKAKEQITKE